MPAPAPDDPRPPTIAPLELARLRGSVRASLFGKADTPPRVGRYTLLRCIGHGGMGIVYAAHDEELGREVAIKLLRADLPGGDDRRLADEARALARLSHPNVVGVFDVGVHEGQRFIAMEYVVGDNLRRWLAAPRTLREVLRVFAGAGRGLHAAHQVGLVHRDFKPDNVLVADDGRPRVLDFGLARPPDSAPGRPPTLPSSLDPMGTALSSAGQVIGTPAYMAPEQYLGEPADARSDQFSFAVALYHAVYGERPFDGDDPHALALSIVRGVVRPTTPRYPVPPWLEQLLERALRVDAAQRFPSMDAVVSLIDAWLDAGNATELDAWPSRAFVAERGELDPQIVELAPTLLAPQTPSSSVPLESNALAIPPETQPDGAVTSVSVRRSLPMPLSEGALERITRELDRLEGCRGKISRLGGSLIWSTPALEVHVDRDGNTTQLLLWRRLAGRMRRSAIMWTIAGGFVGSLGIAVTDGMGFLSGGFEVLLIFALLFGGAGWGHRRSRELHAQAVPAQRAQLEFFADRLTMLARAPDPG